MRWLTHQVILLTWFFFTFYSVKSSVKKKKKKGLTTHSSCFFEIQKWFYVFILQDNSQLCHILLCATLHKIWAIFDRDLDWNTLDDKERSSL